MPKINIHDINSISTRRSQEVFNNLANIMANVIRNRIIILRELNLTYVELSLESAIQIIEPIRLNLETARLNAEYARISTQSARENLSLPHLVRSKSAKVEKKYAKSVDQKSHKRSYSIS